MDVMTTMLMMNVVLMNDAKMITAVRYDVMNVMMLTVPDALYDVTRRMMADGNVMAFCRLWTGPNRIQSSEISIPKV